MTPGLTSIVIPTYNHGAYLADAIESALAQTAPVEVVVVNDGSTDGTESAVSEATVPLRFVNQDHAGPSAARNRGLAEARGEFVMFLDADDVIAPTKVEDQLLEFDDAIGWVICDVDIVDERGQVQRASDRYRYANRNLGGWIREQLKASNFIPMMSPLIRRSILTDDVRFGEQTPEDWHFLYRLASVGRVRYLPKVLATYRKRRQGRHTLGLPNLAPTDGPIRLNLGCGTPGSPSWHPMPGFVNLDRSMGWLFEDGLPQYADGSVAAISVSHALMYVHDDDWPAVCAEFARVLAPGGVIRITEDETVDPRSSRVGGWQGSEPAVALTSPAFVRAHLERVGLTVVDVDADTSRYRDRSLCQAQHGAPPDVFFLEGLK